jgi:CRISP-associated protein Cas1
MDDLHLLPKFRDALSYLYVEHARIDRHEKSIAIWDAAGYVPVPAASLALLMLGPGTAVTHAAVQALADNNCLVVWCGEENVRFYAFGTGGTRSAAPLLHQAKLVSDPALRLEVVKRMYRMRFADWPGDELTIDQLRGMEGARVRKLYAEASARYGVEWEGRSYDRQNWDASDIVNRALSAANSCLYGLCHAAILTTGYSPGLGFIHTGKQLSFVYDLADLYKHEITIPVAFEIAQQSQRAQQKPQNIERATRLRCRDQFRQTKLLARIVPDIQKLFGVKDGPSDDTPAAVDLEKALPGGLWAPEAEGGSVAGGMAYTSEAALPSAPALPVPSVPTAPAAPQEDDGPFGPDPGWPWPDRTWNTPLKTPETSGGA